MLHHKHPICILWCYIYIFNLISSYRQHMWILQNNKRKKLIHKVNNETDQRSIDVIQDVQWQIICSFNSGAVLLFRCLGLLDAYTLHTRLSDAQ